MHRNSHALVRDRRVLDCDVRTITSASATEYYLTLVPGRGSPREQAAEMYAAVAAHLRETGAFVVQERLFAAADVASAALDVRALQLGSLDDGVLPTLLSPASAGSGSILALQVYAIHGPPFRTLCGQRAVPCARAFHHEGIHYLAASSLRGPCGAGAADQTRRVLGNVYSLLADGGGTVADVARTWIWTDDILSWYDELNRVRTGFFKEHGLTCRRGEMPASTGIGVRPADGAKVAVDFLAAWGRHGCVERFSAVGNQRSAYEYGSAFSRAARVRTPAGTTVFCSGTAAIDAEGRTCHGGDPAAQIEMTVENVHAVLRDMGCGDDDVVQAMAYCATPETQSIFEARHVPQLAWPVLVIPGTVCRADLLFEIEVTACIPGF